MRSEHSNARLEAKGAFAEQAEIYRAAGHSPVPIYAGGKKPAIKPGRGSAKSR